MNAKFERALASNPKLRKMLENVSDSYSDFVIGTLLSFVNSKENQEKMIKFLEDNPDATSSDVCEYEAQLLRIPIVGE